MRFFFCTLFSFNIILTVSKCESLYEVPAFSRQNGQVLSKRDISENTVLIQSEIQKLPSVKNSDIDEFYNTKEFNELMKEYKLKVDKSKLPNIKDVASLLGTENSQDTFDAIRDFASTNDGLDLIKSYLDSNDDISDSQPNPNKYSTNSEYKTNSENESGSWWNKLTKWLGFSQSTKIDSTHKDLTILSSVLPIKRNSLPENVKYIGNFFQPAQRMKIPINPPFKVFNSQSINLSNQPYTIDGKVLPPIRMTEHQYNEMMKSVNLNYPKLAKYETEKNAEQFMVDQLKSSEIKRSFSTHSQPIRTSYDLPTGYLYKANPDEIDKISKILSEESENKKFVSSISDLTAQQQL